jgi:hypothetical protein
MWTKRAVYIGEKLTLRSVVVGGSGFFYGIGRVVTSVFNGPQMTLFTIVSCYGIWFTISVLLDIYKAKLIGHFS